MQNSVIFVGYTVHTKRRPNLDHFDPKINTRLNKLFGLFFLQYNANKLFRRFEHVYAVTHWRTRCTKYYYCYHMTITHVRQINAVHYQHPAQHKSIQPYHTQYPGRHGPYSTCRGTAVTAPLASSTHLPEHRQTIPCASFSPGSPSERLALRLALIISHSRPSTVQKILCHDRTNTTTLTAVNVQL